MFNLLLAMQNTKVFQVMIDSEYAGLLYNHTHTYTEAALSWRQTLSSGHIFLICLTCLSPGSRQAHTPFTVSLNPLLHFSGCTVETWLTLTSGSIFL